MSVNGTDSELKKCSFTSDLFYRVREDQDRDVQTPEKVGIVGVRTLERVR